MSGLNAGGSSRQLIVEMALSTPTFLTCSLWAVNTVIAEERLLLQRPTRAASGMGASTHGWTLGVMGRNGPTPDFRDGAARSEVYPFSVIYGTARGPIGFPQRAHIRAVRTGRFLRPSLRAML